MKLYISLAVLLLLFSTCGDDEISFEEQLEIDTEIIDSYIASNNIDGVQIEPNGLRYVINREGFGPNPGVDDEITVDYEGFLLNGTPISDSLQTLVLNTAIEGWQIGIPLIKEGGSITLYIQSGYAWGVLGQLPQGVGPNDNVIFDIELLDVAD